MTDFGFSQSLTIDVSALKCLHLCMGCVLCMQKVIYTIHFFPEDGGSMYLEKV
jgi:Fe-S-cluster-containing dehydrogenase component